ncbi:MAG: adenine phosphoribosyltransferase [Myxococcales bacterium]|nr:adenine phosphoribosyltransferase [Myxococcales bacterium]
MPLPDEVASIIRDVPDFPIEGILFKDITPVLQSGPTLTRLIDHFKARYAGQGIQRVVGIESRGFIFGTALAYGLGIGLSLVRKPGKLPWKTERVEYELEYGTDALEIHTDSFPTGESVVVVDDLLATGGTAAATVDLITRAGGKVVECAFVIELSALGGREKLSAPTYSLLQY